MQFRMRWLPIGFEYLRLFASGESERESDGERVRKSEKELERKNGEQKHGLVELNFAVPTTQLWLARIVYWSKSAGDAHSPRPQWQNEEQPAMFL